MIVLETLEHMKITFLPLWLELTMFLSAWPQTGMSQYQSLPEVVIPLRVPSTYKSMEDLGWISYSLHFGGQRHIVHMKAKKHLMSRALTVFTYTDQGALVEDQPFVQNDCYYHGYVEGDPNSMVTLSTCLGSLQGILQTNGVTYEIKPKVHSATFEHLVYKMDDTQYTHRSYGLTEEEIVEQLKSQDNANSTLMQSSYTGWWPHRHFLELAIVVDYGRFIFRKRNVSIVEMDVFMGVNLVDDIYSSISLDVVLTGIEVWSAGNPYSVTTTRHMMEQFCKWKKSSFNSRVAHDSAHIIVKQDFCYKDVTLSYFSEVCNINLNCGLECIMDDGLASFRTYVTHEIGHTLGMTNDDSNSCTCERKICVMNKRRIPSDAFSNCSYAQYLETISRKNCLTNVPNPQAIFVKKRCGNGVVEDEEECDCGSLKLCAQDECCSENCTLASGAACASGLCCHNCQFMPSGTVCRERVNQCDLPEWCNGSSAVCPEDVYVEDGIHCLGRNICFQKRCNTRDDQCRKLFGEGAKNANKNCYLAVNTRGDRFGNCGKKDNKYVRCNYKDALCGRVQCENIGEVPHLSNHFTVHSTQVVGNSCWGTDYHFGMNVPDIGEVKDGTECGPDFLCLERKCVLMPPWEESCMPMFCNKRGICNNKHHCHCNEYWAPPNCLKKGYGGSIDSGPPPARRSHKIVYIILLIWLSAFIVCSFLLLCFLCLENRRYEERRRYIASLPRKRKHKSKKSSKKEEENLETELEEQKQNVEKLSEEEEES
ncbi:disintegrin and metalloproteinase domain-containing protein 21-like [Peromyscus maniculatus bairdii]|uniref:disintegrin and metalloproteinase domain-containing protein 21-like n=1 Tax=Peromyscus maniculatus bairdii TaxID=230844 RepID=UPI00042AEB71|nr:disintegrin and metalloproteinase domain-containing protein 21-like [Peromyscus maniculatus bairdii]XP_042118845.1 disintegrin and metalloproteinase domain-containing protein 21-like [Peromyscus maniculatus bairdii]